MPISLLDFTLASLVPYRSLNHLDGYFYFSLQISTHKNAKIRQLFRLIILIVFYKFVHFIGLFIWPCTSPADHFRQVDIALLILANLPPLNFLASFVALQTVYNLYAFYFNPPFKVNSLLSSLLLDRQTNFFIFGNAQLIGSFKKWFRLCSATFYSVSLVLGNFF